MSLIVLQSISTNRTATIDVTVALVW